MANKYVISLSSYLIPDFLPYLISWRNGYRDPEIRLLPLLCDRGKLSIDVGVASGIYFFNMLKHSKGCAAFDPRKECTDRLKKLTKGLKKYVLIENVALSDSNGRKTFKIMVSDPGRSTIEVNNSIEIKNAVQEQTVEVRKIDSYKFSGKIGLVKIDIEGHEESALNGAQDTLTSDKPNLIIEIENAHNPGATDRVFTQLKRLGYEGLFIYGGKIYPIEQFNAGIHQNPDIARGKNEYVNNFMFIHSRNISEYANLLREYLAVEIAS